MGDTIHHITTHYLMRSALPIPLGEDESIYVEYGFARFTDTSARVVTVDEPLVLLSASHWFNANHQTDHKFWSKHFNTNTHGSSDSNHIPASVNTGNKNTIQYAGLSADSNGFENYLAFCLRLAFTTKKPRLCDIFKFEGAGRKTPAWTQQQAELVSIYRSAPHAAPPGDSDPATTTTTAIWEEEEGLVGISSGPSATLGVNAKDVQHTLSWLNNQDHTAICFPHPCMGPDLLFVLKLQDGSTIWVALQAKRMVGTNGQISKEHLRRSIQSVSPNLFFIDKVRFFYFLFYFIIFIAVFVSRKKK